MLIEDQRFLHEDLERLEQAVSDRALEDPKNIRDRLSRDHQIGNFLNRLSDQSQRLLDLYADSDGARARELQTLATGDPFDEFYKQLSEIKNFHRRYPNAPVENLERAYKRRIPGPANVEGDAAVLAIGSEIDNMFSGEEAHGRYLDLNEMHEIYLNLPGVRGGRRLTYLQYLDIFDIFTPPQCPIKRPDKVRDEYFQYIGALAAYLEGFLKRTRPLEDVEKTFAAFDADFDGAWSSDTIQGWSATETTAASSGPKAPAAEGTGEGVWCPACAKEFQNDNIYKSHLVGRKHIRAAQAKKANANGTSNGGGPHAKPDTDMPQSGSTAARADHGRLKERAVAEREHRIRRLAAAMQTERGDTRVNVERRQGMTERERQQELEALYAESALPPGASSARNGGAGEDDEDGEGDDKIYNPLKLPLSWDGKPIPFWLYKLHGLGVEFSCEICGNFVYMGRRAFDKHFNEARHIYGLKCLGITNTTLFREITGIEEAQKLWAKIQTDKKKEKQTGEAVVQMEDGEGNVMPEKVYYDLQKQGLV